MIPQRMAEICFKMSFFTTIQEMIEEKDKQRKTLFQICKYVKCEKFRKGEFVFRQNDTDCEKAYVVINGEVAVVRQTYKIEQKITHDDASNDLTKNDLISPGTSPKGRSKKQLFKNRSASPAKSPRRSEKPKGIQISIFNLHKIASQQDSSPPTPTIQNDAVMLENNLKAEMFIGMDAEVKKIILNHGELIVRLGYGKIFGQFALQNNNAPRSASIIATEDTTLMVIYKKEFEIIKEYYSAETTQRQAFLSSILPKIENIKELKVLSKFIHAFESIELQKVSSIYKLSFVTKEDKKGTFIYFLRQGECQVSKLMEAGEKRSSIPFMSLQAGAIIGEECLSTDSKYHYTVTVKSSSATFLRINKVTAHGDLSALQLIPYLQKKFLAKKYLQNKAEN